MKWVNVLQGIFTVFTSSSFIYHLNKKKKKRKNSIQILWCLKAKVSRDSSILHNVLLWFINLFHVNAPLR